MKKQQLLLSILAALVVTGCASSSKIKKHESALAELPTNELLSDEVNLVDKDNIDIDSKVNYLPSLAGNDVTLQQGGSNKQSYKFTQSSLIEMAAENMPLRDFVHYVFGDLLKVNYVLDETLVNDKQAVSLKIEKPISAQQLFDLSSDLLLQNKLAVRIKDDVFYVVSSRNLQKDNSVILGLGSDVSDVPLNGDTILQLVPLEYTNYAYIAMIMNKLVKAEIYAEPRNGGLTIFGKRDQVVKAVNLIRTLDQPALKSQYVAIYPLVFLGTSEFTNLIKELLSNDGFDTTNAVKFTPVQHLNAVIVHATDRKLLERIESWQIQLDRASETTEKQYFVYYPKLANAQKLGENLQNILALQQYDSGSRKTTSRTNSSRTNSSSRNNDSGKASSTKGELEGVAVDEDRNALVFYLEPKQYQAILPMLNQLDVLPKQVIIEATILEVTLTDRLNYGVEWFIENSTDSFGTRDGLGDLPAGLTYSLSKPNLDVLISALASNNEVKVVSNPKLMVANGEAASFNIGTEVPTITSSVADATEGNGQVLQSIQYRTTGVSLSITPIVNAQNYIELDITQSLSEAGENELSGIDSPLILNRDLQTKVLARDGQTIVLAGLISENVSNQDTKVPLLGDIPILGEAFKNTTQSTVRTELLLLLTPKVINHAEQFDQIKQALSVKFEQIDL